MAQTINTNVASLNAQRNLTRSQGLLNQSLQRLSSGLRVNSAKDDAAGLAIAERFTTQIRGLNQAARNANDGISLAQTTESVLGELANNLQRIRELAIQSANATNSASDRAALDAEVQQRLQEIDRIASQTSFNGLKVLDGTFGTATFQVGANVGETISVNLSQGVRTNQIGKIATGTSTAEVTTGALSGSSTITVGNGNAVTIGASVQGGENGQTLGSAFAKAEAINSSGVAGLTVTAENNVEFTIGDTTGTGAGAAFQLTINGQAVVNQDQENDGVLTSAQIADAINANSQTTGVTAALDGTNLRLSAADGRDIIIGQTVAGGAGGGLSAQSDGSTTVNGTVFRDGTLGTAANATAFSTDAAAVNGGTITLTANENIALSGDGLALGFGVAAPVITLDTTTLDTADVLSVSGANNTISRVDAALTVVSDLRGSLGAIQNRFESTIANLTAVSESLTASRSRIQDADFAAETANLTRAQILQQAGISVLSQANAQPQLALSLLQ